MKAYFIHFQEPVFVIWENRHCDLWTRVCVFQRRQLNVKKRGSIILSDLFFGQTGVAHSILPVVSCGACRIKGTIRLPKFWFTFKWFRDAVLPRRSSKEIPQGDTALPQSLWCNKKSNERHTTYLVQYRLIDKTLSPLFHLVKNYHNRVLAESSVRDLYYLFFFFRVKASLLSSRF